MPRFINPPVPKPQTEQQIANALAVLYDAVPSVAKFGPYFYLQNFDGNDFPPAAGWAMQFGGQSFYNKFAKCSGSQDLNLFLQDMSNLNSGANRIFSGTNQNYQVF